MWPITNKCYKLHGYPPGYKPKGSNKPLANQVLAILPIGNGYPGGVDGYATSQFFQNSGGFPNAGSQPDMAYTPQNSFGSMSQASLQVSLP